MTHYYFMLSACFITALIFVVAVIIYFIKSHNMQARFNEFMDYLIAGRIFAADLPQWKTWVNGSNATQPPVKPA